MEQEESIDNTKDVNQSDVSPSIDDYGVNFEHILIGLPKSLVSKARALLKHLVVNGLVKWDQKGQVSVSDQPIPHSHISDLVRDCLQPYKNFNPVGAVPFYQALGRSNVPLSLITNPIRRGQIQAGFGAPPTGEIRKVSVKKRKQRIPPPPGIPSKISKPRNKSIKWFSW